MYLPSESEEVKYKVHSLSLVYVSTVDTECLLELLFVGFLSDNQLVQVDGGQVSNTGDQGLVIWRGGVLGRVGC